ncbi:MAG TPA: ABC transporter substrate-binding protein [Pseudolysinimonas sp.]|nr:ABC transporter substrate-binding protein [Pseudolysinimonas sp.]
MTALRTGRSPGRRRLLGVGATLAGLALLAGCAGSGEPGKPVLTTVGYGGAVDEASFEAIGQPFAEAFDVEVRPDAPLDYSKIKAQVESGKVSWDVVKVEPYWAIQNCGTYLEKIDQSLIETLGELPAEGITECGIPLDTFGFVMLYDHDAYPTAPTSWTDFFDVAKFPGKRAIWNFPTGMALEAALLADGVPVDSLYPLDVDRALAKLDSIRDDLVFYDTGAIQSEQIESGEVEMSIAWSARAVDNVKNGAPFSPVWKDHFLLYDTLSIVKGSSQVELAHQYLSFATSVEQQVAFAERMPYAPANANAKPALDDVQSQFDLASPEIAPQGIVIDQQWWAENFDAVSEIWTKWSVG